MSATHEGFDWKDLAEEVGSLTGPVTAEGWTETGGTEIACRALELLLGAALVRSAVDHCMAGEPGAAVARSVLWHVHPWAAMLRCREIYADSGMPTRLRAVELLREFADRRVLPWIPQFLDDANDDVQVAGAGIVEELLAEGLAERAECHDLLARLAGHPNRGVRAVLAEIERLEADEEPA